MGTGLGCAVVVGNKLFTGVNGMAGEIWPSPNKNGTIEDIVSGNGVSATYLRLANQWKTAKEISLIAYNGDANAIETWNIFGEALAVALAWGVNMIDPDIVILGIQRKLYNLPFTMSMDSFLETYLHVPAAKTQVVKAVLGDYARLIGAASLMIQGKNKV